MCLRWRVGRFRPPHKTVVQRLSLYNGFARRDRGHKAALGPLSLCVAVFLLEKWLLCCCLIEILRTWGPLRFGTVPRAGAGPHVVVPQRLGLLSWLLHGVPVKQHVLRFARFFDLRTAIACDHTVETTVLCIASARVRFSSSREFPLGRSSCYVKLCCEMVGRLAPPPPPNAALAALMLLIHSRASSAVTARR